MPCMLVCGAGKTFVRGDLPRECSANADCSYTALFVAECEYGRDAAMHSSSLQPSEL